MAIEAGTTVAAEIRAELARQQRSVKWLSAQTGISPSSLSRKINGSRALSIDEAVSIARALEVTLDQLISTTIPAPAAA